MSDKQPKFEVGEVVLYQNGTKFELGVVKKVIQFEKKTYLKQQGFPPKGEPAGEITMAFDYFVYYHTGDTPARTSERDLHKIVNAYAFNIERITELDSQNPAY